MYRSRILSFTLARLCLVLMLAVSPLSLWAEKIYTWEVDGKTVFSDKPRDADTETIEVRTQEPSTSALPTEEERREKRQKLLQIYAEERQEKREQAAEDKQARKERKQRCARAKDQLATYERAGYLYNLNDDGERAVYDDGQRDSATKKAKAAVAKWCG